MPKELWGQYKDTGDDDDTFIEFSACGERRAPPESSSISMANNRGAPEGEVSGAPSAVPPDGGTEPLNSRGGWGNKLDFLFSCISVSVGLGNVWRFPYLCYKNGGGAFLVTYTVAMFTCGIPLFFQEVAIGQYLGAGGMTLVGQLCPILQGVGYATMTIVFFLDIYYCVIIAWTIFYLLASFSQLPYLPWEKCGNWWNSDLCFDGGINETSLHFNNSDSVVIHTTTPVEEYFDKRVLQITSGINELGGLQWELLGCLALGWLLVYFIVCRGLHQSGKVIWFTALFPYFVLAVLLVRAVTLPGASDGLLYYITPRWHELLGPGPWIDGATQIFFAYSIGTGALPALGSYNNFHHNCYKDAVITCIVNTATCLLAGCVTFSILGHIALEQHEDVANVVKSGPGLVFLTYPEVVLKLPGAPAWAAIFFIMLVILGIDSEFCIVESLVLGLTDRWPLVLTPHRGKFTLAMCILLFALGIPMVTHGGAYIFQLMDFYACSGMSLLWVCFFQTIAISWLFGADRFADCVHEMMGVRLNAFWRICWVAVAPLVMLSIFIFYIAQYTPVTYGQAYHYPDWAIIIGICLSLTSMMWVPGYFLYYLFTGPGTLRENLTKGLQPAIKSRNNIATSQSQAVIPMSESSAKLIVKNNSFLSTR